MDRRSLIKNAGIAGVLAAGAAPAVHAQGANVRWRLASSFPKSLATIFGSAEMFAKTVKALSGGKFEVSVHAAGELMPAFGVVDGIQNGTVEMAQTASYYFTGKDPIFAFGCAVPFGLTARQMDAWMEHGNGRKLMDEFYAKYNIKSRSAGNTGTQMGGWYRKEIKTVKDLKGLKMRMGGGLFGEAMQKLGRGVRRTCPPAMFTRRLKKAHWTPPSSSALTMTRNWASTRWRLSTTIPAGGKVALSWSFSSTPRPMRRCRPNTRPWWTSPPPLRPAT